MKATLAALTALIPALPAQDWSFSVVAATDQTVRTSFGSVDTIPAGTDVTAGFQISAADPWTTATSTMTLTPTSRDLQLTRTEFTRGDGGFSGSGAGWNGRHSILLTLSATRPAWGVVDLDWRIITTPSADGAIAVDVGDDGSFELVAGASATSTSLPISWGPQPLTIRIRSESSAAAYPNPLFLSPGQADATFTATIRPDPTCTVTQRGTGCGVVFDGWIDMHRDLTMEASGLSPAGTGLTFLVLGLQELNQPLPIPTPGCRQYTDLIATPLIPVDASGNANWSIGIPVTPPVVFHAQLADLDAVNALIRTSRALKIDCP